MNEEQKNRIHAAAGKHAAAAVEKAKTATGWKKWLYIAAAAIAATIAAFTLPSCAAAFSQTPDRTAGVIVILPLSK